MYNALVLVKFIGQKGGPLVLYALPAPATTVPHLGLIDSYRLPLFLLPQNTLSAEGPITALQRFRTVPFLWQRVSATIRRLSPNAPCSLVKVGS